MNCVLRFAERNRRCSLHKLVHQLQRHRALGRARERLPLAQPPDGAVRVEGERERRGIRIGDLPILIRDTAEQLDNADRSALTRDALAQRAGEDDALVLARVLGIPHDAETDVGIDPRGAQRLVGLRAGHREIERPLRVRIEPRERAQHIGPIDRRRVEARPREQVVVVVPRDTSKASRIPQGAPRELTLRDPQRDRGVVPEPAHRLADRGLALRCRHARAQQRPEHRVRVGHVACCELAR